MVTFYKRMLLKMEDWLRYHPRIRRLLCHVKRWRPTLANLCAAARLADDPQLEQRIQADIVDRVGRLRAEEFNLTLYAPDYREPRIQKAAILKPYIGPHEKGIVFVSFESQWVRLLSQKNVRRFAEQYTLVISPSSSPHNVINYVFPHFYPGPIFTLISNAHDLQVLQRISNRFVVVPLYASHWVNPQVFQPLPRSQRRYDLIMVASWGKVKRHHALFSALRSMPRDLRVLLVGQDQDGRTADTIRNLARWYGVADRLTILSDQPYAEVARLFCQSRSSVVLSRREGSCVVVAESLFADTPVALLHDAVIGSRVFINEQTGRFLDGRNLAKELTEFIASEDRYQPRAWAEKNIACWQSTEVLNCELKQHALARGEGWTQDIAPLQWSPGPGLARAEERQRLAGERERILREFALEIGRPAVE